MDFKNASELLALCTQQQLPISEIMRRRECQLGRNHAMMSHAPYEEGA